MRRTPDTDTSSDVALAFYFRANIIPSCQQSYLTTWLATWLLAHLASYLPGYFPLNP